MKMDPQEFVKKVNLVIGKEYDPETYNCWSLVTELVEDAPPLGLTAHTLNEVVKGFASHMIEKAEYLNRAPENQDIVVLGSRGRIIHVGVFYNAGIIHASPKPKGVMWESMVQMRRRYSIIKVVRYIPSKET